MEFCSLIIIYIVLSLVALSIVFCLVAFFILIIRGEILLSIGMFISAAVITFILVFILIPPLLPGRISTNESSAIRSLRLMYSAEIVWSAQDCDGNGLCDTWTYDISCLHRALRYDNITKVAFIPLEMAMADAKPARSDAFGSFRIADLPGANPIPYNGYYFQMIELDQNGNPYSQGKVNGILAVSKGEGYFDPKFAIVAYPAIYGTTGVDTYILNQEGTVYYNDCGSDARKIILQWPGNNPATLIGPSGQRWMVYD